MRLNLVLRVIQIEVARETQTHVSPLVSRGETSWDVAKCRLFLRFSKIELGLPHLDILTAWNTAT